MDIMLWRICRILANQTRLNILRCLFRTRGFCVRDIADKFALSEVVASQHLKHLSETGFLKQKRESKWVFYEPIISSEKTHASELIHPLKHKLLNKSPNYTKLIRLFTAITHPRRVDITKAALHRPIQFQQMVIECNISSQALYRHLDKLIARNVLRKATNLYKVVPPRSVLKKELLLRCENEPFSHTL